MSGAPRMLALDAASAVPASQQTRLAAFLISAHSAAARRLALALPGRVGDAWQAEMNAQFFREMELVTLLVRATQWAFDPGLAILAWRWELAWLPAPVAGARDAAEGLAIDVAAFGHALHAGIRPATLLPPEIDPASPFAAALGRIEFESGRMLQAQLLMLKSDRLLPVRDAVIAAVEFRTRQMRALWDEVLAGLA